MAAFTKYDCFSEDVAEKAHNFGSDSLTIVLSNTVPAATDTNLASMAEITAQGGYTSGGFAVAVSTSSQTGGTYSLNISGNPSITAVGTSFGPFRYVILHNATANRGIGWWDYNGPLTVQVGESFTVKVNNPLIQII